MRRRMVLLPVEGAPEVVAVGDFREMARMIDADLVERVRVADDLAMAVDESGRYRDKKPNVIACLLYGTYEHGIPVVGDVLVGVEAFVVDGVDWVDADDVAIRVLALLAETIVSVK